MDALNAAHLPSAAERLKTARRIVVKVGSSLLVDRDSGSLRGEWLNALAEDVAALKADAKDVLLVSSGSIALGRRSARLPEGVLRLEESQAAAAVGQIALAEAYRIALGAHGLIVAQILLTLADSEERRRYLNARATLTTLLGLGAVPVINENDTVATTEIRFGDNDRLAARVAQMISADCLVLLSDIDGLYSADPRNNADAEHLPHIQHLTPEIEAMAGGLKPKTAYAMGSGGMVTKLDAARVALGAGCHMIIASGTEPHPLARLARGARASLFHAEASPRTARKQWIAGSLAARGRLCIDQGAERALQRGMSLLPAGVTAVAGDFERGDAVLVINAAGKQVARGLSAYSAEDASAIAGRQSGDIEEVLGYRGRSEMIHRDDLVLLGTVERATDNQEPSR